MGLNAFGQAKTDTLKLASQYRNKAQYGKAAKLLTQYTKNHPKDASAVWLLAQTTYWQGHNKKAKQYYNQALQLEPNNDYLQIDYARSLSGMGEWKQANQVLAKPSLQNKKYPDIDIIQGQMAYWKGNYKQTSLDVANAQQKDRYNPLAKQLQDDVAQAKAPWLKVSVGYTIDGQPLQNIAPSVEAGFYFHPLSSLQVGAYSPIFIGNGNVSSAQWLQVSNRSLFTKSGTILQLGAGIVKFPGNQIGWSALGYLKQPIYKKLYFEVLAEHKPYFTTLTSIDSTVNVTHFAPILAWDDKNGLSGQVTFDGQYFDDKNLVYAIYGWLFAPPIKVSVIELRFGYGYSYSNSKESRFVSDRSLADIIANYSTNPDVTGVYSPYFTPNQQHVHSLLVSFVAHATKKLDIGTKASVGVYAYTQNPYLYLDSDASNQTVIARGFANKVFFPLDLNVYLAYKVTQRVDLRADYTFLNTNFFTSHYAGLTCKITFWHEKQW